MRLFSRASFFLPVLLAALLVPTTQVLADDSVSIEWLGNISQLKESAVSMEKETVEFTIPTSTDSGEMIPSKATFWFHNPTNADIKIPSIFPDEVDSYGPGGTGSGIYAENIYAQVNGHDVTGTTDGDAYYAARSPHGELTSTSTQGYLFDFVVPAQQTMIVTVMFDSPPVGGAYNYLLASGAGWSGPIKQADFIVHYPYELESGWVQMNGIDLNSVKTELKAQPVISGNDMRWSLRDIEPTTANGVLQFWFLSPEDARVIRQAKVDVLADAQDPNAWSALAAAYEPISYFSPPRGEVAPLFVRNDYFVAGEKVFELEGVSTTHPTTLVDAGKLLSFYSGGWSTCYYGQSQSSSFEASGEPCNADLIDLAAYQRILNLVKKTQWPTDHRDVLQLLLSTDAHWRKSFGYTSVLEESKARAYPETRTPIDFQIEAQLPPPAAPVAVVTTTEPAQVVPTSTIPVAAHPSAPAGSPEQVGLGSKIALLMSALVVLALSAIASAIVLLRIYVVWKPRGAKEGNVTKSKRSR